MTTGWFVFCLFVGLVAVSILLWLSMRRHLKRIRVDGAGADGTGVNGTGVNGTGVNGTMPEGPHGSS
jgi:hypothetical protein